MDKNLLILSIIAVGALSWRIAYVRVYLPRRIKKEKKDILFFLDETKKYQLAENHSMVGNMLTIYGEAFTHFHPKSFRDLNNKECDVIADLLLEHKRQEGALYAYCQYPCSNNYNDNGLYFRFPEQLLPLPPEKDPMTREELKEKICETLRMTIA
jgi:hypothetical protein